MVLPVRQPGERQHLGRHVAEPRVPGDRGAVGVPGDDQGAVVGPQHRRDLPEALVTRVRVLAADHGGQLAEQGRDLGSFHNVHHAADPTRVGG